MCAAHGMDQRPTFLNLLGVPHSLEIITLCLGWYLEQQAGMDIAAQRLQSCTSRLGHEDNASVHVQGAGWSKVVSRDVRS